MDDMARPSTPDSDLATIVLGRTSDGRPWHDAPERVPVWTATAPSRGYDPRSVVILAIVVAALAAVVGWAMTVDDPALASRPGSLGASMGVLGASLDRAVAPAVAAKAPAAPAAMGANLAAGRLVGSRAGSGSGLVTLAVRNAGDAATAAAGTDVLVLADGAVMGSARLGPLAPGASASVDVPLDWCPAGSVAIVAIIDPRSAVHEANEHDNSTSRSIDLGC